MKNFSIIIPVYNEQSNIIDCLQSIINSNFPKKNYEILIINDCSTDDTKQNCENFIKKNTAYLIKLINHKTNQGRMKTRQKGATSAKFQNLLFIDSRVTISNDSLKYLSERTEKAIIAGDIGHDFSKTIYDRYFYLLRKKIYKNNFPQKENIHKITKKNFNTSPKGTTACLFNKTLFLNSMKKIKELGKNASDDTKLFEEILKQTSYIIKDNNFKINYKNRNQLKEIIKHTYNRGPKFVDYYLKPGNQYYSLLLIMYTTSLVAILLFLTIPETLITALAIVLIASIISSAYLAENIKDFFISIYLSPIILISFYLGLIKGLFVKFLPNE